MAKVWTEEELNLLILKYRTLPAKRLLKLLPERDLNGIYCQAKRLGLKKAKKNDNIH